MNTQSTFSDQLKHLYNTGGMTVKLIFINLLVFLFIGFTSVIGQLMQGESMLFINGFNQNIFTLDTDILGFVLKPWGLFTSIFAHFSFMHLLFNMLMLYFTGKAFELFFNGKKLLYIYLIGGVSGGLFEILAHLIFPIYNLGTHDFTIGASGATAAIFIGLVFHRPSLEVKPFGLFTIPLFYVGFVYLAIELLSLGKTDNTAHFAHIGGALAGVLFIKINSGSSNFMILLKNIFTKKQPKFTVQKGGSARGGVKTDEEYNYEAKQRQVHVDAILDKIAKSGYESLSKAEKEFLFKQSQNGK